MSQNPFFSTRHSTTSLVGVVMLWIVAFGLTGCNLTPTPEPEEGVTDVAIQGNAFVPKEVTIKVGESVRWTNRETFIPHTATSGDPGDDNAGDLWDSGDLLPGESFVQQFDETGEFVYF